jgi:hypothetical protein
MVLSPRERNILIVALATAAFLVLYYVVISPYLDWRAGSLVQQEMLQKKVRDAREVIDLRARADVQWKTMVQPGIKNDPAEAESQVLHAIHDWSEQSGVVVTLQKPQRSVVPEITFKASTSETVNLRAKAPPLPEIKFQAQGTGTMKSLALLLWQIQTAKIPIKVTELRLDSHKEGQDDLMFKLSLSTVYTPPPAFASSSGKRTGTGGAQ